MNPSQSKKLKEETELEYQSKLKHISDCCILIRNKHGIVKVETTGYIDCPVCNKKIYYILSAYKQKIIGLCDNKNGCLNWRI